MFGAQPQVGTKFNILRHLSDLILELKVEHI